MRHLLFYQMHLSKFFAFFMSLPLARTCDHVFTSECREKQTESAEM